ncbi:MAG TPA: response regulator [Rhizomicrobium sp.]|jgi:signal transduction histidine kinase/DNA-binding response OmpR family regulator|nr:response regulator [Rhizomicrobium sp.]
MNNADWLILNIDDLQPIRYAKTRALQRAGFSVMEAASGTEGIACVEQYRPALVICDVKLPDINGLEVSRTIKERFPGTLVLQVSASFVTARDRAVGLERGADSYLTEPVEPEELVASVRALLRLKQYENELTAATARRQFIFALAERQRTTDSDSEIMQMSAEELGRQLAASRVGFYRPTPSGNLQFLAQWTSEETPALTDDMSLAAIGGELIDDYVAGRTIAVADVREIVTGPAALPFAAIGMPLMRAGQWSSTLFVHGALGRQWTPDEIALVEEVGKLAWDAVLRARANNDLRLLNIGLEERIAERSRELVSAEAQLRQSQKMEAVGQLTGGLAHDFNNLLTAIIGGIDLIRRRIDRGDTASLDPIMSEVTKSAHNAANLVQRLLAFSRQQSLDVKPLDLNAMIGSIEALLKRSVEENIELRLQLDPELAPAATDANQLETAILNLVINARDAMPDGGTITVSTANHYLNATAARPELAAADYVVLAVADTGTGMPSDVLDKVFEPFFTTKPIGQGTGLGLSMVYGFAKQARGHVEIESELDRGTTVRIYLPQATANAAPAASPTLAGALSPSAGETVLVAEDNPGVRLIIADLLREMNFDATIVTDGQQAVDVIKGGKKIDLLITDVGLPGMNGRQVAEFGRNKWPEMKVLFITGYAEAAKHRADFLLPGADLLAKPFQMENLAAKIHELLATSA